MTMYARVRDLTGGEEADGAVAETVGRLAQELGKGGERGVLQLSIGGDDAESPRDIWAVSLELGTARQVQRGDKSDVVIVTSPAAFGRMAAGTYSPVEAFQDGAMRIRGDLDLGKRLLRQLAGPEGRVECA